MARDLRQFAEYAYETFFSSNPALQHVRSVRRPGQPHFVCYASARPSGLWDDWLDFWKPSGESGFLWAWRRFVYPLRRRHAQEPDARRRVWAMGSAGAQGHRGASALRLLERSKRSLQHGGWVADDHQQLT